MGVKGIGSGIEVSASFRAFGNALGVGSGTGTRGTKDGGWRESLDLQH